MTIMYMSGQSFLIAGSTIIGIGLLLALERRVKKQDAPASTVNVTPKSKDFTRDLTTEEQESERSKQYQMFHVMSP
jgi:hypothetical protein